MSKYGGCREEGARAGLPRFEIRPNIFDTPVLVILNVDYSCINLSCDSVGVQLK
jgi:hypothetical protein